LRVGAATVTFVENRCAPVMSVTAPTTVEAFVFTSTGAAGPEATPETKASGHAGDTAVSAAFGG
jgi:hypothetical protein